MPLQSGRAAFATDPFVELGAVSLRGGNATSTACFPDCYLAFFGQGSAPPFLRFGLIDTGP